MAFTGEREYIQRELDYWWDVIEELREERPTASPERQAEIDKQLWEITLRYDVLYTQLGQLWPRESG